MSAVRYSLHRGAKTNGNKELSIQARAKKNSGMYRVIVSTYKGYSQKDTTAADALSDDAYVHTPPIDSEENARSAGGGFFFCDGRGIESFTFPAPGHTCLLFSLPSSRLICGVRAAAALCFPLQAPGSPSAVLLWLVSFFSVLATPLRSTGFLE